MSKLCAITVFFNPANFKSLLNNYYLFRDNLHSQGVDLITIEMTFGGKSPQISGDTIVLNGDSVMWQKERLINFGIENLPSDCDVFAWLDCDILFKENNWASLAIDKLKTNDVVQLFKRVFYLPKGHSKYSGSHDIMLQSVIWQEKIHKNWLQRRKEKKLPFSSPGFAWAARKTAFPEGLYDKNIIGSGDTFIVDCLLNSWDIHGYAKKFNDKIKVDMEEWKSKLPKLKYDYVPVDIYHLWHGSLKNRGYMDRHEMIAKYDYDPKNDIILKNGVYEWNSDKTRFHKDIISYFENRSEDE